MSESLDQENNKLKEKIEWLQHKVSELKQINLELNKYIVGLQKNVGWNLCQFCCLPVFGVISHEPGYCEITEKAISMILGRDVTVSDKENFISRDFTGIHRYKEIKNE